MTSQHKTLISLTHESSGIIYFPDDAIAYAVDWSGISGFPKITITPSGNTHISSSNIDIPDVKPTYSDNLLSCFSGAVSMFDCTPDKSFSYEKNTPRVCFEFDTPFGRVYVIVVDAEYDLLSVIEYEKRYNIHHNTVLRYCANQKIPAVKRNGKWVIFDKKHQKL